MALRLRRAGRQWVQTLKAAESARGGLSARPEWESPARLVRGTPRIDITQLAETPLPALLARHRAQAKLQPLFRVRVRRTLWEIDFRGSRIEVATDRGHIEAERGGRRVSVPLAEIELELREGRPEDLTAGALRLTGRGCAGQDGWPKPCVRTVSGPLCVGVSSASVAMRAGSGGKTR